MKNRDILITLYGLHVIWTGLWRSIQAAEYKPNALWFCLTMGLIVISASFLYRKGKQRIATIIAAAAANIILIFYAIEFISKASTEANFRVGLIILSSIALLVTIFLPKNSNPTEDH